MSSESTHTHTLTTWFELNEFLFYSSWHLTKKGGDGENSHWFCHFEQMVWTRKSCVTSDLKAEYV